MTSDEKNCGTTPGATSGAAQEIQFLLDLSCRDSRWTLGVLEGFADAVLAFSCRIASQPALIRVLEGGPAEIAHDRSPSLATIGSRNQTR